MAESTDIIRIDGSEGEGGGQIVRTALALSMVTQKPFSVVNIRAGRPEAGLKNQHLFCIRALEALSGSKSVGAKAGSGSLDFFPAPISQRSVDVSIGTAGSIPLLLQSIMLPCLFAPHPVRIRIEGGTDVAWSMPIDYVGECLLPHLRRYGEIELSVRKRGYYPKGGGDVELLVKPNSSDHSGAPQIELGRQGTLQTIEGIAHASQSLAKANVAERMALAAKNALRGYRLAVGVRTEYSDTPSDGCGIVLWARFATGKDDLSPDEPVVLGADALGEKNIRAEVIGERAAKRLIEEIGSKASVDSHLADNLIPLLGLVGGTMLVSEITEHTRTNMMVTEKFLGKRFSVRGNRISAKK